MKLKFTTFLFLINTVLLQAQLSQQWLNNFCCFDSVGPHTFSFPLGKEFNQDTLTISFFEDYFLKFEKINVVTGDSIQCATFLSDTIQSSFYYGGGTTKITNQYITSAVKYNNINGQFKLFHSAVDNSITQLWSNEILISSGKISAPISNLSGSNFYTCGVSDSIRIFKQTIGGMQQWITAFPLMNTNNIRQPYLYINSLDQIIIYVRNSDSILTHSSVRLIKVNSINGSLLLDSVYTNSLGTSHVQLQVNDTLKIAFLKVPGQEISFLDINLGSLNEIKYLPGIIPCLSDLTKFSVDSFTHNYYLKTSDNFLGYTEQDTLLFNVNLAPEKQDQYDLGGLAFDQQNVFLSYSFYNSFNNPPNNDIRILKLNKTNGSIVDSADYNDIRNTDENFIDDYFDEIGRASCRERVCYPV